MRLRFYAIGGVLAWLPALPAPAQSSLDAETLAQPREGESVTLDLQSIRRFGDVAGRFHVYIAWADSSRPIPEDYFPRSVRYSVNCQEKTLTLAAVGLLDRSGQLQRTLVVPPGASDPVKPAAGTEQAKLVQRVCMF